MKYLPIAMFVCLCAASPLSAQAILPFPVVPPNSEQVQPRFAPLDSNLESPRGEVTPDQNVDRESAEYRYQHSQEQAETPREAVIRVAKEKGEQRRYRLAAQKALGISNLRPIVSPYRALGTYSETWYGGQTVPGVSYPRAYTGYGYQYQGGYRFVR